MQNDRILGTIKQMDLSKLIIKLDIQYYKICDRVKYLLSETSGITGSIEHNFAIIKIDSYNSLPIEKILTFHNFIILIKSVFNMNKNYYYNIFLEKGSYKDKLIHDIFK